MARLCLGKSSSTTVGWPLVGQLPERGKPPLDGWPYTAPAEYRLRLYAGAMVLDGTLSSEPSRLASDPWGNSVHLLQNMATKRALLSPSHFFFIHFDDCGCTFLKPDLFLPLPLPPAQGSVQPLHLNQLKLYHFSFFSSNSSISLLLSCIRRIHQHQTRASCTILAHALAHKQCWFDCGTAPSTRWACPIVWTCGHGQKQRAVCSGGLLVVVEAAVWLKLDLSPSRVKLKLWLKSIVG